MKPLTIERAFEGAMLVAAAATLSQNQAIRVPDGAEHTNGFSLQPVLPEWDDAEISVLLSRPIFDEAIYGAVRFHHRSVREYLAAAWMAKLLERPASRRQIEDLLFKNQFGIDVVIPTTRPLLPWLAIFDERIREKVRRIAPEVIFEGGDPSALPLPTRREILAEVCDRLASGRLVHSATEYAAVQRFAHADIADDIRQLLKTHASSSEVVSFLTRMIWLGQLKDLLPEAKAVALSPTTSQYTRIVAIRALRECGTQQDQADLRKHFIDEAEELNREWLGEILQELTPTKDTIAWAIKAIGKAKEKAPFTVDRLTDAAADFVDGAAIDDLPEIIKGLAECIARPPFVERRHCEVSKRFSWLMKAAARAVERLVQAKHPFALDPISLELIYLFRTFRHWRSDGHDIKAQFSELVPVWPELNSSSFWHDVAGARKELSKEGTDRITWFWQARSYAAFWKFGAEDFDTAQRWIQSQTNQDDKLVALTLAFAIYRENGRPKEWREHLKKLVKGNAELEARLQEQLHPPKRDNDYARMERRWKRSSAARAKREAALAERNKAHVLSHVKEIRDAEFSDPSSISRSQWHLHECARKKSERMSKWTSNHWRLLIPMYDKDVAEAYRDAVLTYWRRYKPTLQSEGAAHLSTPYAVIFGLTGIATEIGENPKAFDNLKDEEVELLTRYALKELNGFPNWLPALYAKYAGVVSAIIVKEIEYEISIGEPGKEHNYVLNDVSWSGEWMWNDLSPLLFALLSKTEPNNASQLHAFLKIIQGSVIPDAELAKLAEAKISSAIVEDHKPDWFAVWTGVDPVRAIPAFQNYLKTLKDDASRTECAMQYVTKLWGGRRSETFGARPKFATPPHLKTLYILMHDHIRVQDDIDRAGGGAYSPELRDDAQDARNRILQELDKLTGKEAFLALQELAEATAKNARYAYLEMMSKRKAEHAADLDPWAPVNVREFHDRLDRVPRSHRELADLAELRLLDLKDSLEEGDDSVANILKEVDAETKIRNFIGRELRDKAFGRYNIPQEEELADAKKPDLRFHGVQFDAPVPFELKIADNWSGKELLERLENQLAGDYLRDVRSNRGLFVLVYRGEKKSWEVPGKAKAVDFVGLVEVLREYWQSLASKFPGIDDIKIIGIDLTARKK